VKPAQNVAAIHLGQVEVHDHEAGEWSVRARVEITGVLNRLFAVADDGDVTRQPASLQRRADQGDIRCVVFNEQDRGVAHSREYFVLPGG